MATTITCDADRSPFSTVDVDPQTDARAQLRGDWQHRCVRKFGQQVGAHHDGGSRFVTRQPDQHHDAAPDGFEIRAIPPSAQPAGRNRPRPHLPQASIGQGGGTRRRGDPDSLGHSRPAATAPPPAIRVPLGGWIGAIRWRRCMGNHALRVTLPPAPVQSNRLLWSRLQYRTATGTGKAPQFSVNVTRSLSARRF